jgi:hypothetical protein
VCSERRRTTTWKRTSDVIVKEWGSRLSTFVGMGNSKVGLDVQRVFMPASLGERITVRYWIRWCIANYVDVTVGAGVSVGGVESVQIRTHPTYPPPTSQSPGNITTSHNHKTIKTPLTEDLS